MPSIGRQYVLDNSGGGGVGLHRSGSTMAMMHQRAMPTNEECGIRDVWKSNLLEEFETIRQVVQHYPYVAMDTEFPGVVARPVGDFKTSSDYQYQLLRCNVDLLKIIQIGFSFFNEQGRTAPGISTWQFNFQFNLTEDMYAKDSIELLQNSGLQFGRHEEEGISPTVFGELLMDSGIVLVNKIRFLSFHSGYDFGYMLKLLTDVNLPMMESEFFDALRLYFPNIYDVKYLMKSCKNLKGGLQEVAEEMELERVGPQHQAGSDSLLTGGVFFRMRELFFEEKIDDQKYNRHLYGLGGLHVQNCTEEALVPQFGHPPPPAAAPSAQAMDDTSTTTPPNTDDAVTGANDATDIINGNSDDNGVEEESSNDVESKSIDVRISNRAGRE